MTCCKIPIPRHWTAEQADAVCEFLHDIISVIWEVHENALIEMYHRQKTTSDRKTDMPAIDLDDTAGDIPF